MAKENGKRYDETFKKETVKYILENNNQVVIHPFPLMKSLHSLSGKNDLLFL